MNEYHPTTTDSMIHMSFGHSDIRHAKYECACRTCAVRTIQGFVTF